MRKAKIKTKALIDEAPKRKRGRPRKVEAEVVAVAPKKRGRPRKDERLGTPESNKKVQEEVLSQVKKKRGRPRKVEAEVVAVAPKKRGRPKKEETKQEKMTKIAKLGKRNYTKAIENMAMEKISKRMKRKGSVGNTNGNSHGEPVSVKTYSYESQSRIVAGPDIAPEGIKSMPKKVVKDEMPVLPIEKKIKQRLVERGYVWKEETFKIIEKTPLYWAVEFMDKKQGEITSYTNVVNARKEIEHANTDSKVSKLSKVELNRYIKKMEERGIHPKNIKVIENTPEFFRIEFNDGDNGSVVTAGHVKGWDV